MNNLTTSNSAFYEQLTPENCAMLLIDHQAGLFLGVQSMDQQILKNNAIGLAKTAKIFNLPTVLFTSSAKGPNGPTIPEIVELFPDHEILDRSPINLWNDPRCRAAVEATNRQKLIMAAITTDVCLVFPALAAVKAGYDVYAVIDASGTWSSAAELAAVMRLTQAGVIPTNWIAVAAELKHDEDRKTTPAMNKAYSEHMGLYDFLGDIAAVSATVGNKAIALRFYEPFNTDNVDIVDLVLAPDWVEYPPSAPDQGIGREGFKPILKAFRTTFPDLQITIEDVVAEGDKVVVRSLLRGTHQGEFLGIAPTNKKVEFNATDIHRISNGRIVETWHIENYLALLEQLGIFPLPSARA